MAKVNRKKKTAYKPKAYKRRKRPQKVHFRRRYARAVFSQSLQTVWNFLKISLFGFLVSAAAIFLWNVWHTSEAIRVQSVRYSGDIPGGLESFLNVKPQDNIFLIPVGDLEKSALETFPQLEKIRISRRLDRSVWVRGLFRKPVALYSRPSQGLGLDATGAVFPLESGQPTDGLPRVQKISDRTNRKNLASLLFQLKKHTPNFYKRLKDLKTDTMNTLVVTIDDETRLYWGDGDPADAADKAKKVLAVLSRFEAKKGPATLRFLEKNRVVIDENWTERN